MASKTLQLIIKERVTIYFPHSGWADSQSDPRSRSLKLSIARSSSFLVVPEDSQQHVKIKLNYLFFYLIVSLILRKL